MRSGGGRRILGGLRDFGAVMGIAVAIVVALEMLLRLLYGEREQKPSLHGINQVAFQGHPEYVAAVKPNLRDRPFVRRTKGGEVVTHWSTNSVSFRGPEIGEKTGLRIIVYGDSNIFARFSDLENTFPIRLQERLQSAAGRSVEVINAGVPGFGPDQSFLRFREEVDRYRPDMVVFHVFADNDFGDLIRNRIFYVSASGQLVKRSTRDGPDPCFTSAQCAPRTDLMTRSQEWASSLFITQALRKVLRMTGLRAADAEVQREIQSYLRMNQREYDAYVNPGAGSFSHFVDHYDYDLALRPHDEASKTKVRVMQSVLEAAKELATQKKVKFWMVIQPSSRDLTENLAPNFTHMARFSAYKRTNLTQFLEGIAQSLRIDYVNLFGLFERNHPERLYFADGDDHWNDEGQRVAAEEVARCITTKFVGDLAGCGKPGVER